MTATRILEQLRTSVLFADDFPRRQDENGGQAAVERAPGCRELVDLVRELGEAKHEAAVSSLVELWNTCGLVPVRDAAGRSLRDIGTHEARAALVATLEDADHRSLSYGVLALFDEDPSTAFDRCEPRFEESALRSSAGGRIAEVILRTFTPSSFRYRSGVEVPSWHQPNAPTWFVEDHRWLNLCVRLRRHRSLGATARDALRYADKDIVETAIKLDIDANPPTTIQPSTASDGDLLQRYLNGEHTNVWRELRTHQVLGGALLAEANAVAEATMTRVANAANVLAQRLQERGWASVNGAMRESFSAEGAATLQEIERRTGMPVPPSVRAFWKIVGGIDFVWDHNLEPPDLGVELAMEEMDPLAVGSAKSCTYLFEEWDDTHTGVHPELLDPYYVALAADGLHKANISGGAPYGIELPFHGADPVFMNEGNQLAFVDYLRLSVRWGGFPGLQRHQHREDVKAFVEDMSNGLVPF